MTRPGSRGGVGFWNPQGHWQYGKPGQFSLLGSTRLSVDLKRQRTVVFRGRQVVGPDDLAVAFRHLTDMDRERLWSVSLDAHARILGIECVSIGVTDHTIAYPREILKVPLGLGAKALVLVHNHPSANPHCSPADQHMLANVRQVASGVGIHAVKGIVVSGPGWSEVTDPGDPPGQAFAYPEEPPGRVAPVEAVAVRQRGASLGAQVGSPEALADVARGLFDPGARTIAAVMLDRQNRVLAVVGLGTHLAQPTEEAIGLFTRAVITESATAVGFIAGRNGPRWSGHAGQGDYVDEWVQALQNAAGRVAFMRPTESREGLGLPGHGDLVDFLVVDEHSWSSRLRSGTGPLTRAPLVLKAAVRTGAGADAALPAGATPLGTTRSGKPVLVSGADSAPYSDADHHDAGKVHAKAHAYHQVKAALHRNTADHDEHWTRAEAHHHDGARHQALADHHEELTRLHLTAAGAAGHVDVDVSGETPTVGARKPASAAARTAAREALMQRTPHDHPGDLTPRDRAAYAAIAKETLESPGRRGEISARGVPP